MRISLLIAICVAGLLADPSESHAIGRARRAPVRVQSTTTTTRTAASSVAADGTKTTSSSVTTKTETKIEPAADALAEVNRARAARGLPPYIRDEGLTQGAISAALARARGLIRGHTANDFAYLPPGSSAAAAGCGALEASWGFQSCAMFERYRFAGAATVRGRDGRLYHHLFVR